jgi:hypothetical protein
MSHWVLLVAPLVLASFVLLFAFVGCGLNTQGTGNGNGNGNGNGTPPEKYTDLVKKDAVSYWRLGDPAGATKAVDSKDGNDGTYSPGGVTLEQAGLVKGDTDTAAQFDGSTGYVSVPHNDDSLNPAKFTVEALVDVGGGDGQRRTVVSSRDVGADVQMFGYVLYASDQNKWEASVGDGASQVAGVVSGPDVTPGTHYLAMTYNGTTLKLYVDPKDDSPATADLFYERNTARELRIGAGGNESATPLDFFNGVIDEVAVYDTDLDFGTIQKHFALATTGAAPE